MSLTSLRVRDGVHGLLRVLERLLRVGARDGLRDPSATRGRRRPPPGDNLPLKDGRVVTARAEELRAILHEPNVGHVRAVPAVRHRASAERRRLEQGDDAAVVARGQDALLPAAVASDDGDFAGVDVGAVGALVPHAGGLEAEHAGPSVPCDVLGLGRADDLDTLGHVPVENLVIARVGEERGAILGPAHVRDERGVALAHAHELVPVTTVVHIHVVVV